MAPEDGSAQSTSVWPLPKFHFEVQWDHTVMRFQEVSGLDAEAQPIEYRHGGNATFSAIKMPGLRKFSDVTLKKGVFKGDSKFWDWLKDIQMNTVQRKTVTIRRNRPHCQITRCNQAAAFAFAKDLNLGMAVTFVAFHQHQIDRGHPCQNSAQIWFRPTVFMQDGKAVRRCQHHL